MSFHFETPFFCFHSLDYWLWVFRDFLSVFFHVEWTINHKRHPLNMSLLFSSLLEFKRKTKLIIIYIKMSTISLIHTNIHTHTFNMCELVFCFGFCLHFFNLLTFYPFSIFIYFRSPSLVQQRYKSAPANRLTHRRPSWLNYYQILA